MMIRADPPKPGANCPVVLAVDDDKAALEWIATVLKKCEVLTTTNGADALDVVRSRRVDCVLLDLLGLVAEAVGRRRANVATLLLIGADAGVIASIAVILEPHMTDATAVPRLDALPDPGRHAPPVVVYDAGAATPSAANLVERLRERYSRSKIL